jgi:hypothetical protein
MASALIAMCSTEFEMVSLQMTNFLLNGQLHFNGLNQLCILYSDIFIDLGTVTPHRV